MDFSYLTKYNQLPKELRDKINNPAVVSVMDKIERQYNVNLAAWVMKVMVKEVALDGLKQVFMEENNFPPEKAAALVGELEEKIFRPVADYLHPVKKESPAETHLVRYEDHLPSKNIDTPAKNIAEMLKATEKPSEPEHVIEQAAKVRSSNFFFSPEDEEEIRSLTKKAVSTETPKENAPDIESTIDGIVSSAQINFGSEFLADRFKQILRTYVKGIRNAIDTKITFKKSFDSGGLSFDDESADKVIKIADSLMSGDVVIPEAPKKMALPEDALSPNSEAKDSNLKNLGIRDVEYDFAALAKAAKDKVEASKPKFGAGAKRPPVIPQQEVVEEKKKIESKPEPKNEPASEADIEVEREQALKISVRQPLEASGKVKMEDIKHMPVPGRSENRVMTPIDELGSIDVTIFRRMGQHDPYRSVAKIKEKIALLEEEDYSKRVEGIKAWKSSPLNRLYLSIGERGIIENKPVDVIMAEMRTAGQESITAEEFETIMDLNRDLRF